MGRLENRLENVRDSIVKDFDLIQRDLRSIRKMVNAYEVHDIVEDLNDAIDELIDDVERMK